jgi:hypothetical protein
MGLTEFDLVEISKRVSDKLWADLKSGKISKVDIYVIRRALWADPECPQDEDKFDLLEERTTRRIVNKVG